MVRLLRTGDDRLWLAAGAVLGVGLLNKSLIGAVVVVFLIALVAVGPREVLRSRWVLAGAGLAILGGLPYGLWQLAHGLPQSSWPSRSPRAAPRVGAGLHPFQLVLIGRLVAPVWIAGLVSLREPIAAARAGVCGHVPRADPDLHRGRRQGLLHGRLYPVLLGVGAVATEAWARQRARGRRTAAGAIAVALTARRRVQRGWPICRERDLPAASSQAVRTSARDDRAGRLHAAVAGVYAWCRAARWQRYLHRELRGGGRAPKFGPALGLPYPDSDTMRWSRAVAATATGAVARGPSADRVQARPRAARSRPGSTMGSASTMMSRAGVAVRWRAVAVVGTVGVCCAITTSARDPRAVTAITGKSLATLA